MRTRPLLFTSTLALCLFAPVAKAQSVSTAVIIGASNYGYATEDSLGLIALFASDQPTNFTEGSATGSFGGLNRSGDSSSMTFTGSGYGRSDYGRLRAYTTSSLQSSFFNENNAPYFNTQTGEFNPEGTPDYFDTFAAARFTDTLQFGGQLQSGYRARYIFHIDGLVSGDAVSSASIETTIANNDPESGVWVFPQGNESPVPYVRQFATQTYAINGQTPQEISVSFGTSTSIRTDNYDDGRNITGIANFTSTALLERIEIVDASGNLAEGVTVTSGSGTVYTVGAVPEPASMAALAFGGLALMARRRRRA